MTYPTLVIMVSIKVLGKHNMVNIVQTKENNLIRRVEGFRNKFVDLFLIELPSFWNDKRRLIPIEEYQVLFSARKEDNAKFVQINKSFRGQMVSELLGENFNILDSFEMIIETLPLMSHSLFSELQVLVSEL